jgi:hypothetical protein
VPVFLKKRKVRFPHTIERIAGKDRVTDKIIWLAGGIPADFTAGIPGPECGTATLTDLPGQPMCFKIIELVFFFKHQKPRVVSIIQFRE